MSDDAAGSRIPGNSSLRTLARVARTVNGGPGTKNGGQALDSFQRAVAVQELLNCAKRRAVQLLRASQ